MNNPYKYHRHLSDNVIESTDHANFSLLIFSPYPILKNSSIRRFEIFHKPKQLKNIFYPVTFRPDIALVLSAFLFQRQLICLVYHFTSAIVNFVLFEFVIFTVWHTFPLLRCLWLPIFSLLFFTNYQRVVYDHISYL